MATGAPDIVRGPVADMVAEGVVAVIPVVPLSEILGAWIVIVPVPLLKVIPWEFIWIIF
jgi:hypothetical protein